MSYIIKVRQMLPVTCLLLLLVKYPVIVRCWRVTVDQMDFGYRGSGGHSFDLPRYRYDLTRKSFVFRNLCGQRST